MAMSEKQKMLAGKLYHPGDPEILADQAAAKAWMVRYNAALAASPDERRALLAERLASVGAGAVIRPPFHCDYGYRRLSQFQLCDSRCGRGAHRRRCADRAGGAALHRRPSA
mgnify:CR=1 FL=1